MPRGFPGFLGALQSQGARNLPFVLPSVSQTDKTVGRFFTGGGAEPDSGEDAKFCSAPSSSLLANCFALRTPSPSPALCFLYSLCANVCLTLVFGLGVVFFRVASSQTGQFNAAGAVAVAVTQGPSAKCRGTGTAASHPRSWSCVIQLPAKAQSLPVDSKSNTGKNIHNLPFVNLKAVWKDPF